MKQFNNEIVQPKQMSVSELRQWLSHFGEQNKAHFERNQVQKDTSHNGSRGESSDRIQHGIQQLEVGLASSSHSTTSTESLTTSGNDNDSQSDDGRIREEIFVKEVSNSDIHEQQIEQSGVLSDKFTGTRKSSKQMMMMSPSFPAKPTLSAESSVTRVVPQLGGKVGKRSVVQRSREALQRKWAEEKQPTHSKIVQWRVSNGGYKKKVTLKVHK